jgi:hypothetical protein
MSKVVKNAQLITAFSHQHAFDAEKQTVSTAMVTTQCASYAKTDTTSILDHATSVRMLASCANQTPNAQNAHQETTSNQMEDASQSLCIALRSIASIWHRMWQSAKNANTDTRLLRATATRAAIRYIT